jgi:hypothetical protein
LLAAAIRQRAIGDTAMKRVQRNRRLQRVLVQVAQARRSEETRRIAEAAALPVAAFIVVVWTQILSLSENGGLSLATLGPIVWGGIAFAGVATVVVYWMSKHW